MEEITKLIRKRGSCKAQLSTFKNFVTNSKNQLSSATNTGDNKTIILELQKRLEKLQLTVSNFNDLQDKIEETANDIDAQYKERGDFENDCYHYQSIAEQLVAENKHLVTSTTHPDTSATSSTTATDNASKLRKLNFPQIKLPSFNGNFENWLEFRDTYETLIHNDSDLQEIEKYHYLRSALIGNAATALRSIPFQADKYKVAWDHIRERYNNTSLIVTNHIKAILELNTVQREGFTELSNFLDEVTKHLESWQNIQKPAEQFNSIMIHILTSKLDKFTRIKWDETKSETKSPDMKQFISFLRTRTEKLYSREGSSKNEGKTNKPQSKSFVTTGQTCELCKEAHQIYRCTQFINKQPSERIECIKRLKLCKNCLRPGHSANKCRFGSCKKCNERHNTMLHVAETTEAAQVSETKETTIKSVNTQATYKFSEILLATALVKIQDSQGKWHNARVMLDSGSQSNFISSELSKRLKHKTSKTSYFINGINETETNVNQMLNLSFQSKNGKHKWTLNFLVVPKITCQLPTAQLTYKDWNIPEVELADETFHKPGAIDLLIGAELYYDIMQGDTIQLGKNLPTLHKTALGWIVGGKTQIKQKGQQVHSYLATTNNMLNEAVERFWHIEELNSTKHLSKEENDCEEHFQTTHSRNKEGRYIVKLPLKKNSSELGESREIALKRFHAVERKFTTDESLKENYTQFMKTYESLNHMTRVDEHQLDQKNYLPHHAVFKQNTITRQIRVVFDASCKTNSGLSLNDISMIGPTVQRNLLSIVLQFRLYRYALTADVVKMYRQVLVHQDDQKLQLILWRESTNQEVQTYKLNTVTYGTASAPYLATRCLKQLALENKEQFPITSQAILNNFYVDDFLGGSDTLDKTIQLKKELTQILKSAGFTLDKWMSNSSEIVNSREEFNQLELFQDPDGTIKTLGLTWNPTSDVICYKSNSENEIAITKRQILTRIAKLFDPLGLLGPVIASAKMIMQRLWLLKTDWDQRVPSDIASDWEIFQTNLPHLSQLKIPRYISQEGATELQLHGFADASERAYGAAIYIRSTKDAEHSVKLICSKSRVAPLKTQSLPRLELCAALLLSNLYVTVTESLDVNFDKVYLWSDSAITLHWIKTEPFKLKCFVANRVSKIQQQTKETIWKHVSSNDNPADVLSRGLHPHQLEKEIIWWNGPDWLSQNQESWPQSRVEFPTENATNTLELKSTAICHVATNTLDIFGRFSNLKKLQRITALCIRFITNTRKRVKDRKQGALTVEEYNDALLKLVWLHQQQSFAPEIKSLRETNYVQPTSNLKSLHPFLDKMGIIRVGGRLRNSEVDYEQKFPMLLAKNHLLTSLIIMQEHENQLHAGPQMVLATIRLKFWPINGRDVTRRILHKCMRCARINPKPQGYLMGDLPKPRVTPSKPFLNCGIDFCGPFYIRESRRRGKTAVKTYICVFVCFATRAAHLEFVSNLTTEAFIGALKRFIARRGKCNHIYCDNATNFVGAKNELEEIQRSLADKANQEKIKNYCTSINIDFHFIPPRSPNFGGLWEALCKSAKYHLQRVAQNANLTFEEFITLITQIESCLNSRPLTPISSDPHDMTVLTPGHFLIGTNPNDVPSPDLTNCKENRLSHWQRVQVLYQHFWRRWSLEYLSQLQKRVKWQFPHRQLQVGDIVVLAEATPPSTWKLGCIEAVHPGSDGVVRVVSVRTATGVFKRACGKVCLLPVNDSVQE